MRAVTWQGTRSMSVDTVPDPEIVQQSDVVVKVSATAICGSDQHLYNHFVTTMQKGDILGHEFMGEVVDVGRDVKRLKTGDRGCWHGPRRSGPSGSKGCSMTLLPVRTFLLPRIPERGRGRIRKRLYEGGIGRSRGSAESRLVPND